MRSEKQIAASLENGRKSLGPVTFIGKAKSARNSLRHGVLARTVVLNGESHNRFYELLTSLQEELQPLTGIESTLVETMAVARWRQMRLWAMEQADLTYEIQKQETALNSQELLELNASTRTALAFRTLVNHSRSLELMNRYEVRYDRQYDRALRRLLEFREKRDSAKRTQQCPVESTDVLEKPVFKEV